MSAVTPGHGLVTVRGRSRYYELPKPLRSCLHALAGFCVLALGYYLRERLGVDPTPLVIAAGALFCILFAVLHLAPTKIVLGERAVEIRWLGMTRRIPLEQVASVSAEAMGETHALSGASGQYDQPFVTLEDAAIRIAPRDGAPVRVRIGGAGDADEVERRDQMIEAIRRAAGVRE